MPLSITSNWIITILIIRLFLLLSSYAFLKNLSGMGHWRGLVGIRALELAHRANGQAVARNEYFRFVEAGVALGANARDETETVSLQHLILEVRATFGRAEFLAPEDGKAVLLTGAEIGHQQHKLALLAVSPVIQPAFPRAFRTSEWIGAHRLIVVVQAEGINVCVGAFHTRFD